MPHEDQNIGNQEEDGPARKTGWAKSGACLWVLASLLLMLPGARAAENSSNAAPKRITLVVTSWEPLNPETFDSRDRHWLGAVNKFFRSELRLCARLRVVNDDTYRRELARITETGPTNLTPAGGFRLLNERLRSDWAIQGLFERKGDVWTLKMRLVDSQGEIAGDPLSAKGTNLFDLRDQAVEQVLHRLGITPTESEQARMKRRFTESAAALEAFSKAITHEPESPKEIAALCREALESDPRFVEARIFLAGALLGLGKLDEGLDAARLALSQKPEAHWTAQLHGMIATLLLQQDQPREAEKEIAEGLRILPEYAELLALRASLRGDAQDLDGAAEDITAALALDPRNAIFQVRLASIHLKQGKLTNALHCVAKAESLMAEAPKQVDLRLEQALADAYQRMGIFPKALEHYRRLLREADDDQINEKALENIRNEVREIERRSTPVAVRAERPKTYSPAELATALKTHLTGEEVALAVNPIESTPEMARWAREIVAEAEGDLPRARKLFDALTARPNTSKGGSHTAIEVFNKWNDPEQSFWCQEYAKLFVALARSTGLAAHYVHVDRDYSGTTVDHDCAVVFAEGKAWLVDPSYRWFGVPHQVFRVLDDLQTIAHHAFQPHGTESAVELCRAGLKLDPDFIWGRIRLVTALIRAEQIAEARRELDIVRRQAPDDWRGYQIEGTLAFDLGNIDQAREWFSKAVEINPADGDTRLMLGEALFRSGQQSAARREFIAGLRRPHQSKDNEATAKERLMLIDTALEAGPGIPGPSGVTVTAGSYRDLGLSLVSGGERDYAKAAKWFLKAAEMGDAKAQCILGVLHWKGQGVQKDMTKAVGLFRTAADAGNAEAMRLLFVIYSTGRGVEINNKEAVRWIRMSAEEGDPMSQMLFGRVLYEGKIVTKDVAEALFWLTLAAEANEDKTASVEFGTVTAVNIKKESEYLIKEVRLFATAEELEDARVKLKKFKASQAVSTTNRDKGNQ